jgi:hypothetical protein
LGANWSEQLITLLLMFAALGLVVVMNVTARRIRRNGSWHMHHAGQMKRWSGWRWDTRPMDAQEQADYRELR